MNRDVTQSESRPVADGRKTAERHPEDVRFGEHARVLAAEARKARKSFEPPPSSAADRYALECTRDGVSPTVSLCVSARTDDRQASFTGERFELLHRTMNDWLTMYARCYDVDLDADSTVREATEVLLRAYDVIDTAQLLTYVPERH